MKEKNQIHAYDVVIIGTGLAGLTLALRLPQSLSIALISKGQLSEGSSYWAQGGVSAVMEETDSVESHIDDTMIAGAGVCSEPAVRFAAEKGHDCIQWLIDNGVAFSTTGKKKGADKLHLTREGGHSHRRIVHAADATGRAIQTTLAKQTLARENITIFEHHIAIDVITSDKLGESEKRCVGVYIHNLNTGTISTLSSNVVALATGGASKVYMYSSNPDSSTGDGIAIAWRAGCRVANLEFNQFHPTCLYHPRARSFLISEALRGEGAYLRLPNGERFMERFDKRLELAPRDIVARAIDHEIKRLGIDFVHLDISHKSKDFIQRHFPTIYKRCFELGIDITTQPIPVVPAAHYTCGGVMVDLHSQSDVENLYVIGEASCTGLHGANRLASNSLLECLVFGWSAAENIMKNWPNRKPTISVPAWDESRVTDSDEQIVVTHNWHELRRFMWNYVGIVRTDKRLERAERRCAMLLSEISDYYGNFKITADLLELRNLAAVAQLMIRCAQQRKESRGLHYSLNYPSGKDGSTGEDTIIVPDNYHP